MKLTLREVCVHYRTAERDLFAVSDVSFDVAHKEIVALVGPSGCGKSSLLLTIAGLRNPTSGQILIDRLPLNGVPNVGLAFQNYQRALLPWFSVLRNVELAPYLKNVPPAQKRELALKAIDRVGLRGFETARPHELSGGMQQRVQIARILAYDPDFLLLDEPFGSLDAQTKQTLQDQFLRLWDENRRSVVLVTHDVSEAVYMADRVLVMSSRPGRIVAEIRIDIPRPRPGLAELEDASSFRRARREVSEFIREQLKTENDSLNGPLHVV